MMILFIVTSANVIVASEVGPYEAFGGKDVEIKGIRGNLGMGLGNNPDLVLTLNTWQEIKRVSPGEFTKPPVKNLMKLVHNVYTQLEDASQCARRGTKLNDCMAEWFDANAPESNRKIKLNVKNVNVEATLFSDNKAVIETFIGRATLGALDTSPAAVYLTWLNGTPGAKRATKVGAYGTAQEAYDAYNEAKTAGDLAAMKDVLAKADALRVGAKDRDLKSLAEKERAKFGIDDVRAAKQRALAKHSGEALKPEDEVALHFYNSLLGSVDSGDFALLGFESSEKLAKDKKKLIGFLNSIAGSVGENVDLEDEKEMLIQENASLKKQLAAQEKAAGAGSGAGAASGSGGAGRPTVGDNPEGMPLFDIPA